MATIREAAEFLRVSARTVFRELAEARLPSVRVRHRRLIPWVALMALPAAHTNEVTMPPQKRPRGRPAKPMFPPTEAAAEGAVSIEGACAFLGGISLRKFYDLVRAGRVEVARLDGRRVVPKRQLIELIAQAIEQMRAEVVR